MSLTKWMKPIARFEAQVSRCPLTADLASKGFTTGCWEWTGNVRRDGYTKIMIDGRTTYAHRFAYQHFVGVIADGMVIDHRCKNRKCVNPEHLQLVTSSASNFASNGPAAQQASKVHCAQGHPFSPENTIISKQSRGGGVHRQCRICIRARDKERKKLMHDKNNARRIAKGWKPFLSKYD